MSDVHVVGPYGETGTVAEADIPHVVSSGGRLATPEELAGIRSDEAYAQKSTLEKVTSVASMAGVVPFALRAGVKLAQGKGGEIAPSLPPVGEAYLQGVSNSLTGGLASVGMKELVRAAGGNEAAAAYGQNALDVETAHKGIFSAGQIAGFIGTAGAGSEGAALGQAAKAIPGVGIGALGGVAERGAGRLLAGVAERGAAGRAAATAGTLAARGAVEGGLYGAAGQITEDMLGDHEIAADKVFAAGGLGALGGFLGGAALGAGGSLAASGARGLAGSAKGALSKAASRFAPKAEQAAVEGAEAAGKEVAFVNPNAGLRAATGETEQAFAIGAEQREIGLRPNAFASPLSKAPEGKKAFSFGEGGEISLNENAGLRGLKKDVADSVDVTRVGKAQPQEVSFLGGATDTLEDAAGSPIKLPKGFAPDVPASSAPWNVRQAYREAWKAVGAGNGLQSTKYAGKAAKYLAQDGGVDAVGETLLRRGIIDAKTGSVAEGAFAAAKTGTAADLLPRIEAEAAITGQRIGELTDASGGRIAAKDILGSVDSVLAPLQKKAGFENVTNGVASYRDSLVSKLTVAPDGTVALQDLLAQRKALDELVFREGTPLAPSARIQELRQVRTNLEDLIVTSLDEASEKMPGELAAEYKSLKKDYLALSIARDAAEDSSRRASKGASLGLRDMIMGAGTGGGITGLAASFGHKVVRERGNAAAAVLLYRMGEMGSLAKVVSGVDDLIGHASKGLLGAPSRGALPSPATSGNLIADAREAARKVASAQANPEAFASYVASQTAHLQSTAPNLAGSLQRRMTDALAFLARKTPSADPDPYDPHPAPPMNEQDSASYLRYHFYAEQPARFFQEVAAGKITPEGAETARALMPGAFAELQSRMGEAIAESITNGIQVPFENRRKIDALLGTETDPSSRPDHMRLLQANVQPISNPAQKQDSMGLPQAPKRPLSTSTQPSSPYDRLTAGIGRRG